MRVAVATWNGRISPVFDVARQARVVEDVGGDAVGRDEMLPGTDPAAQANRLKALGIELLICGALSQPQALALEGAGIAVIPFTAGTVEEILAAWRAGTLPRSAWSMPGCCGRRRGCSGSEGRMARRRGCRMGVGSRDPWVRGEVG
mgnify:CR=1 FL=1